MSTPPAHGFMVLHSNRLEGLRDLLVQFVQRHPLPPLAPEVLLVQSNGMKHWLEISLAQALGICAATRIELPSTMLWQLYRQVLGPDRVPLHMPLDKSPLLWRLMRLLPQRLDEPAFAPLARYLGDSAAPDPMRSYQLAVQLADVLDGYQNYRSDWLDDWGQGRDVLRTAHGQAIPLDDAQRWQAALWRDLLRDLQADHPSSGDQDFESRAQVHQAFLQALRDWPADRPVPGLPPRLMVFGVTSMPMQTVEALAALGRVCQVLMLVHNPCQYHWGHVVESRQPLRQWQRRRQPVRAGLPLPDADGWLPEDAHYLLHTDTHPLLAAWGKHGRDYLHLLDGFDDVERYRHQFQRVDVFIDPVQEAAQPNRPAHQLAQLQSAVLHLQPLPATPIPLAADDHSLQFVQTHSAQREVEVLHDRILAWLDADASLRPDDIMVMVPDMTQFAPHIHAVFGRFDPSESRHLPYAVADTTARTEPLVQALDALLQLPQLRITRVEWQNWFDVAPLRHRFGLDEADVLQIGEWLDDAGVRWGLDAPHRAPWGIDPQAPDADQNTWLFGLQRLLLGYAQGRDVAAQGLWHEVLATPGVGGLDGPLVQALLEWLQHILRSRQWLQQAHTPHDWVRGLQSLVERFFKASHDDEQRLIERVLAPLSSWLAQCELARLDQPLPLNVVREHWMQQLQQPAMHQRFFGGGVQFATLMPMRAIPFRIVCLLGMNDADYPRRHTPRDFDLMLQPGQWRPGDRSRREDDRYLFLEAVLSARDTLYISWQGKRSTDHEDLPPSVLVAQLRDYLRRGWTPERPAPLQPLHAFSSRYFVQGSGLRTYANDWQAAWRAGTPEATPPLATPPPRDIQLAQLRTVLRQPVEVYLRERLQLQLAMPQNEQREEEPFGLDGLNHYLLTQRLALAPDAETALQALRHGGELALGGFGQLQRERLQRERDALHDRWQALDAAWPTPLAPQRHQFDFGANHPGPSLWAEWAQRPHPIWRQRDGQGLQVQWRAGAVTAGQARRQPRLDTVHDLWLLHLVACASGTPTRSVLIGLDASLVIDPLPAADAHDQLQALSTAWAEAWQRPLPVARKTACAFLLAQAAQAEQPLHAAREAFEGGARSPGEHDDPHLQRVFNNFDAIADELPHWATRLYGPMLSRLRIVHGALEDMRP